MIRDEYSLGEKKHELYLIAIGLLVVAGMLLYDAFSLRPAQPVSAFSPTEASSVSIDGNTPTASVTGEQESSAPGSVPSQPSATQAAPAGLININTADKTALMTLDGIGEVKAQAILDYRAENGPFAGVNELLNVSGIGEKTLDKIRPYITAG